VGSYSSNMSAPISPTSLSRKDVPIAPPTVAGGTTNDGNAKRKVLPSIPIPNSGRVQGAPLSPVKVNVQHKDWPPAPSSATIQDRDGKVRQVHDSDVFDDTQLHIEFSESHFPSTQDIPYRPNYSKVQPPHLQQPQAAVMSPGNSASPDGAHSDSKSSDLDRRNETEADMGDQPVPRLQYHHQSHFSEGSADVNKHTSNHRHQNSYTPPHTVDAGASINRHLTPTLQQARRTPVQRPYSAYSDMGPRGLSPGSMPQTPDPNMRAPSVGSSRSYDSRPISYIDLANVQYPQAPPAPISMDNSQLRSAVGRNASLLSMNKTLSMYRENIKKVNDAETQYAFAIFLIECAHQLGLSMDGPSPRRSPKPSGDLDNPYVEGPQSSPQELLREAKNILHKLSDKGYPFAQYYLADGYASGLFSKGKEDYSTAFPLFVSASKHGHAESGYRAALCYEFGWGTRKDINKSVQFYRQSASKNHPGAMTRLGRACLSGDLGMNKYREGLKWLNRATESADTQYNAAPYHLGVLYETGWGDDVFKDEIYAAKLFTQAADLGHAEASYRLGDAYEHGKLECPRDPALSVHFYTGAAQRGHPVAMMALCAWYMVGAEPVLEKDENEAYEWARQAAELGELSLSFNPRIEF
jgi:TPR repeat protein